MSGRRIAATFLALVLSSALCFAFGRAAILRDVQQHLTLAMQCVAKGDLERATAHTQVVMLDRKIRISATCQDIAPADQGLYRNALQGAMQMWQDALGEPVFETSATKPTDVSLVFIPEVRSSGVSVTGNIRWSRGVAEKNGTPVCCLTADIKVRTIKPGGTKMDYEQLRGCIAHELGHVLGLEDSPAVGDLMGPMDFNKPVLTINRDEIQALIDIRARALAVRREVQLREARVPKV